MAGLDALSAGFTGKDKTIQNRAAYPIDYLQKGVAYRMMAALKRLLIVCPLKSEGLTGEKLGKIKALAILSSDALSSVAYGTEQILLVLHLRKPANFYRRRNTPTYTFMAWAGRLYYCNSRTI
jgi:hypothetical protein